VASATSTDVGRSLEEFIAQANGGAIEADGWALGEEARREVRRGDEPRAATRSRAEIEAAELARRKGEAELAAVKAQLAEAEARAAAAEARAQTVPDLDEATTTAPRMARPSSLPGVPPMPVTASPARPRPTTDLRSQDEIPTREHPALRDATTVPHVDLGFPEGSRMTMAAPAPRRTGLYAAIGGIVLLAGGAFVTARMLGSEAKVRAEARAVESPAAAALAVEVEAAPPAPAPTPSTPPIVAAEIAAPAPTAEPVVEPIPQVEATAAAVPEVTPLPASEPSVTPLEEEPDAAPAERPAPRRARASSTSADATKTEEARASKPKAARAAKPAKDPKPAKAKKPSRKSKAKGGIVDPFAS